MDDGDGKIVRLDTKQKPPIERRQRSLHDCRHSQVMVDERYRTVECADCGRQLDPVQVLLEYADRFRNLDYKLLQMKRYEEKQERLKQKQRERYQKRKVKQKPRGEA